ncbi:MAG: S-adenosylmethionine:tRNA ribosyltransferase-isomerase [Nocardioidaceae bacterium]
MTAAPPARFRLPAGSEAHTPPEERGLARDQVRMLVAAPGRLEHRRVTDLPQVLHPGDLLVVNTSATLPAAVPAVDRPETVHVSTQLDDGDWVVEVRRAGNSGPAPAGPGERLRLPGGVLLTVRAAHPAGQTRLWRATPTPPTGTVAYLTAHGRPIGYRYLDHAVPLSALQTVYAAEPGSAEMPSAGRPLSAEVLVRLMARGVVVAPLVLHTGVSSQEKQEPPQPERFTVPAATARLVAATHDAGRRVVAVGTTVVRALESASDRDGRVRPTTGWTELVLGPERPARVVDGILTGLHEPEASHLHLLEAVAGRAEVQRAYEAVTRGPRAYLWHEAGDTMLFLT